eukprot:3989844-Prymnesium_polylepis.1
MLSLSQMLEHPKFNGDLKRLMFEDVHDGHTPFSVSVINHARTDIAELILGAIEAAEPIEGAEARRLETVNKKFKDGSFLLRSVCQASSPFTHSPVTTCPFVCFTLHG